MTAKDMSWRTLPIVGVYSSAKTASWPMTNALRLELAPKNIRVGALHVARMDTDMVKADSRLTQNSRFPDISANL